MFLIAQTQIFTSQRVSTQENIISHFYLVSITNYKLNTKSESLSTEKVEAKNAYLSHKD